MNILPRSFYLRPTLTVARELLGKTLCRRVGKNLLTGIIVEVEAYLGGKDPASHTYRGKTKRNEVMFKEGGHLYVYFTYGMHFCANVVTEDEGIGHAVLLRAIEPVEGIHFMKKRRGMEDRDGMRFLLTNGPAKLCQALGISRKENGTDLLGNEIFIAEGVALPRSQLGISTRIGIRNAAEKKWRFYIKGNEFISRKETASRKLRALR